MAYQPIQLPQFPIPGGPGSAVEGGIDTFLRMRAQAQAQEQARAELLLRRQAQEQQALRDQNAAGYNNRMAAVAEDQRKFAREREEREIAEFEQRAIKDAYGLWSKGQRRAAVAAIQNAGYDPANAEEFFANLAQEEAAATAGQQPPGAPPQGQPKAPPQGGSPMPDGLEFRPDPRTVGQVNGPPTYAQAQAIQAQIAPPAFGQEPPAAPQAPPQAPQAPQMAPGAPEMPGQAPGPQPGAETPQQANQRRADLLMRFTSRRDPNRTLTFDPNELQRADEANRGRFVARMDQALQQFGPEAGQAQKYFGTLRALVHAGAMKPEEGDELVRDFYRADRSVDAAAARPRPRDDGWRQDQGERRLASDEEVKAYNLADKVIDSFKFTAQHVQNRKFNDMAAKLSASPNAAIDAVLAGEFAKEAQGGAGVLSNSDMDVFWHKIGAADTRAVSFVTQALTGKMGDAKRREVQTAVKELARQAQANLDAIQSRVVYMFDRSSNFRAYKDQVLGTYFPDYRPDAAIAPVAPESMTEKRRARAVRSGGKPDKSQLEAEFNALLEALTKP